MREKDRHEEKSGASSGLFVIENGTHAPIARASQRSGRQAACRVSFAGANLCARRPPAVSLGMEATVIGTPDYFLCDVFVLGHVLLLC